MAVPFNLPEDHNEVEVIITQLQYLLTKLQAALRRSNRANAQNSLSSHASTTRVRTNSSNRSRVREGSSTSSSNLSSTSSANLPDLLNNVAWLAVASQEVIESNSQQTTALSRPTRRRTSSESSCCEESKISEATSLSHGNVQDWNQETDNDNEVSSETKSYSREGILSKIVPGPVLAPFGLP